MTIETYISELQGLPGKICQEGIIFLATKGTQVAVADRVFGQGLLTDGSPIQYKEDYETYQYSPPAPRKVSGLGKPNAEGKRKKIKGGWYATYQAGFKQQQGRGSTPLELTGRLRKDYLIDPIEVDGCTVNVELTGLSADKYEGLTAQKGVFLQPSEKEQQDHHSRVLDQYIKLL